MSAMEMGWKSWRAELAEPAEFARSAEKPPSRIQRRRGCVAQWLTVAILALTTTLAAAQKSAWRTASSAELQSLLPARAPVEREHIETEMRTATGIVNARGRYIAGVVLLTAGYSADGKYSHFLVVQSPIKIGGLLLKPGEYAFGYSHSAGGDSLSVHFHEAATGALVGTAEARLINGTRGIVSLRIWPPNDKAILQIGRFGIPYELGGE
jgi:lysylphosphatidylglycerol synthetase-like protein (DUF2156 family)